MLVWATSVLMTSQMFLIMTLVTRASGNVVLEAGGTVLCVNTSPYSPDSVIVLVTVECTRTEEIIFGFL